MKNYKIEIVFKNDKKEIIYGHKTNLSGIEIVKRIFEAKSKENDYILIDAGNNAYVYRIDDIKNLAIIEIKQGII